MRIKPTSRGVRVIGALLTTVATLSLTAACSQQPTEKTPVQSKDDGAATREKWLKCMHDAGQTQVKMTKEGQIVMPGERPGQEAEAEQVAKAVKDCNAKVPGMQQLGADKPDSKSIEQARGLAKCLRKNGISDMADPAPDQPDTLVTPENVDQAAWNKAFGICGKDYPAVKFAAEKPVDAQ
ncbi:hypothetical protein [Streptomyces sp. NBC_00878]|uniref:hypothetical protein n=1 Tax=Streptomyces sp. NBC_00878 TaxID=2975854 RepID=UPI00225818AE|nr:hypothetical protein [Streptomyces sp. NBC_00878]MCX4903947.1 hypothetical protein [Streptomyces sp. NBC_00878]